MGFPDRLLGDGEHVVLTTRTHGKALAGPVLVVLLTAFLATFAAARADRELAGPARAVAVAGVVAVALVVLLRWVLTPFLRWLTTTYTVTDRRLVSRTGVLSRSGRTVPLGGVTGTDVERGVLDRLLGCGTLVVSGPAEDGRVELHDVPHVEEVESALADQVHRLRHEGLVGQGVAR